MEDIQVLVEEKAKREYGSKLTILKNKDTWYCCYGILDNPLEDIEYMSKGDSLLHVLENVYEENTNAEDILIKNLSNLSEYTDGADFY